MNKDGSASSSAADDVSVGSRLLSLEAGRFFAAFFVMLAHYTDVLAKLNGERAFSGVLAACHFGVPYFFVLSGFIIYHIHKADLGKPGQVLRFGLKRAIRLFPMFWIVSLPMLAAFLLAPSLSAEREISIGGLVADFLLLPHGGSVLSISWTLRHEIVFYLVFALAIAFGRRAFILLAVWLAISALSLFELTEDNLGFTSILSGPLNLGFGLGTIVGVLATRRDVIPPQLGIALGGLALLVLCAADWWVGGGDPAIGLGSAGTVGYLCGSAAIIHGLVRLEDRGWRIPGRRFWTALGGCSYVLYLVHQPLASTAVRLVPAIASVPAEVSLCVLALIALAVALALHLLIERPVLSWLSRRIGVSRRPTADFSPAR